MRDKSSSGIRLPKLGAYDRPNEDVAHFLYWGVQQDSCVDYMHFILKILLNDHDYISLKRALLHNRLILLFSSVSSETSFQHGFYLHSFGFSSDLPRSLLSQVELFFRNMFLISSSSDSDHFCLETEL